MGETSRVKIIRAAADLFAVRGYASTNTKDIAAAAGVNETTLFRQFGDKAALMEAAIKSMADEASMQVLTSALAISDFEESIQTFAEHLMHRFTPNYLRISSSYALEMTQAKADAYTRENIKPVVDILAARIKKAQGKKNVTQWLDPYLAARTLIVTLYGHAATIAYWGDAWRKAAHVKSDCVGYYVDIWLRGVLHAPTRLRPRK